ncbi:MAG: hypothetical protein AAB646_02740 [Patescibacteria group bacterium]
MIVTFCKRGTCRKAGDYRGKPVLQKNAISHDKWHDRDERTRQQFGKFQGKMTEKLLEGVNTQSAAMAKQEIALFQRLMTDARRSGKSREEAKRFATSIINAKK